MTTYSLFTMRRSTRRHIPGAAPIPGRGARGATPRRSKWASMSDADGRDRAGKTFLGLRSNSRGAAKGKRAIFICDRRTLIEQTSAVADSYGLTAHSVLMADHWRYDPSSPFQIASAQTLARRKWPDADLIVIDEAHVQMSVWVNKIKLLRAHVIGLSATPFSDGLGSFFSNLVCASSMHALTESGVLVPMRVFLHQSQCAGGDSRRRMDG